MEEEVEQFPICCLEGHTGMVTCVCVSDNGKYFASGSSDMTIRVWSRNAEEAIGVLKGHTSGVTGIAMSGDGVRIVSSSYDKTLMVWDTFTMSRVHTIEGHTEQISELHMSSDGNYAATTALDSTVRVWDITAGKELWKLDMFSRSIHMSRDGKFLITFATSDRIRVWDIASKTQTRSVPAISSYGRVRIGNDGAYIVVCTKEGTVKAWDKAWNTYTLAEGQDGTTNACISDDCKYVVMGILDETLLQIWGVEEQRVLHSTDVGDVEPFCRQGVPYPIAISGNGKYIVFGLKTTDVYWKVNPEQNLQHIKPAAAGPKRPQIQEEEEISE